MRFSMCGRVILRSMAVIGLAALLPCAAAYKLVANEPQAETGSTTIEVLWSVDSDRSTNRASYHSDEDASSISASWDSEGLVLSVAADSVPAEISIRSPRATSIRLLGRFDAMAQGSWRYRSDDSELDHAFAELRPLIGQWNRLDGDEPGDSNAEPRRGWRLSWIELSWLGGRPDPWSRWELQFETNLDGRLSQAAPSPTTTLLFLPPAFSDRAAWVTAAGVQTQVVGSPDPLPPYRLIPTAVHLPAHWPIQVVAEPGSRSLWIIEEEGAYGTTHIVRAASDAADAEADAAESNNVTESADGASKIFEPMIGQPEGESEVAYSIAFHPQFVQNGWVFVGSNGAPSGSPKKSRVVRYTVQRRGLNVLSDPADPAAAAIPAVDPSSRRVIIEWDSDGHNGAAIAFGIDGMLYVTSGDGTSDSDRNVAGQGTDHLLAKVLRIDVDLPTADRLPADGVAGVDVTYRIPKDNPFVDDPRFRAETFAYGLRNPWRIAVDPVLGHVWVGNNGQDLWEQVYRVTAGANYGWSLFEGSHPFHAQRTPGPTPISLPTFEHHHSEARSLTGGVVYRGSRLPELHGAYVYGDYATGRIWGAKLDAAGNVEWQKLLADGPQKITCIELDADGELIIADHGPRGTGGFWTLEPLSAAELAEASREEFPRLLSETGLFASVVDHQPIAGSIPYDVNSELWSDGATKARFIVLPPAVGDVHAASETQQVESQHVESQHFESPRAATRVAPATISVSGNAAWVFPEGTALVKSFGFPREADASLPQRVRSDSEEHAAMVATSTRWHETRVMVLQQGEWAGYSYRWNADGTDAELVAAEGFDLLASSDAPVRERSATGSDANGDYGLQHGWRYPSRTECLVCHSRAAGWVLGLSMPQINGRFDSTMGGVFECVSGLKQEEHVPEQVTNRLEYFAALGVVSTARESLRAGVEASWERGEVSPQARGQLQRKWESLGLDQGSGWQPLLVSNDRLVNPAAEQNEAGELVPVELRARSYLQANCAHCHVEAGGGNAKIDLSFAAARERWMLVDEKPVHASAGWVSAETPESEAMLIAPGFPERSVLLGRVAHRGSGQMPPVATNQVDPLAVELLSEWIRSMKPAQ